MAPPSLPGFEHVRLLGSGGYSDVFLYQQQMPRREVAIKVLLAEELEDTGRRAFHDEANAMASVSTHPFIVTVFHADVSAGGHPYLVMEYYPRPNFSVRARSEQIPVAEVLRVGIQVASAVETAHRAGILHRDIKPANILTSEYNRPGLTDFGIATTTAGGEAEGMSIPWSPPEVVNSAAPGDATADVYSLAATVYTLLAGRSPFEVVGGSNRSLDLIQRIESGSPPPTGRADVPGSLERVLRHGMSRSPLDRPSSAAELARMLQSVEVEQGWSTTQLEIREDPRDVRSRAEDPGEDGTRLKAPVVIRSQQSDPSQIVDRVPEAAPWADPAAFEGTVHRSAPSTDEPTRHRNSPQPEQAPLIGGIGSRPVGPSGRPGPRPVRPMPSEAFRGDEPGDRPTTVSASHLSDVPTTPRRGLGRVLAGAIGAVAVVVVIVAAAMSLSSDGDARGTSSTLTPPPPAAGASRVVRPDCCEATALPDGRTKFTWTHDVEDPGEFTYRYRRARSDDEWQEAVGGESGDLSAVLDGGVSCIEVAAFRGVVAASEPAVMRCASG